MTPDAWLAMRLERAPAALRDAVERPGVGPVAGHAPGGFGAALWARAEALLAEAVAGPPTHETALTLLAADALVTLACEWAAEHDPAALAEFR